jgi:hypothetical protein
VLILFFWKQISHMGKKQAGVENTKKAAGNARKEANVSAKKDAELENFHKITIQEKHNNH